MVVDNAEWVDLGNGVSKTVFTDEQVDDIYGWDDFYLFLGINDPDPSNILMNSDMEIATVGRILDNKTGMAEREEAENAIMLMEGDAPLSADWVDAHTVYMFTVPDDAVQFERAVHCDMISPDEALFLIGDTDLV